MATIKFTYGDVQDNAAYVGEENTISVDTEKKTLRVHDGVTPGGSVLATEDQLESFVTSDVEIIAGDGLTGGGSLDGDQVNVSLGTPSTITGSTINESSANSHSHAISLNKNDVGLSNVDNTSDLNKPISNATQTALNAKVNTSAIGVTVAALVNGKVPLSQMDDSVLGQVEYKGTWNAATNVPTLPATPAEKGIYYVVSTGGTFQSISFAVGDWIISNGSVWQKVDNTDAVSSVAGRTGAVTLTKTDVGLSNVDNTSDLNKPISNATQTALNAKAPLASPVFTGNPEVPTQLTSDNSKKVANTEFVKAVVDARDVGVTSVSGTAPINVSGGTSTPTISITPATQSSAGSMAAADKAKLDGIQAGAEQNTVDSVAGKTGDVTLSASDIGGLGTAATANLTTSAFDVTAGRVLKNGDWGIPTDINMWATPHANVGGDTGTDLNTLTTAGWWRKLISPSSINRPAGGSGYWYLLVLQYASTTNTTQIAFPYGTTTENGNIQYRHCYGGVWGAWRAVYDSSNQIALGSTLSSARTVLGISNVDNTSDLNKPVSTATQTALNNKLDANANAVSASKLATARTIALAGDVTGSASFDGSGNVSITATVADDSHTHDTRYPVLSAECVLAAVPAGSWVTIAQVPSNGGRAYGEFIVYDNDSGKHNMVKIIASHSYGQSVVACVGGNRFGIRTIAHVRVLGSTTDWTYGGAKLQVYIENTCALRVRALMINQISGWSAWSEMTPVVEGTPAGWAEVAATRYDDITNPQRGFSGSFSGSGALLTGLNASNISTGTLAVARGGTGVTTSTGSGNNVLSVSPELTGTPTAPTAAAGTSNTQIATTEFVQNAVGGGASGPGLATAWVNFNGSIHPSFAIRESYNVSSITNNGTGQYTVNFATPYANARYVAFASGGQSSVNYGPFIRSSDKGVAPVTKTTTALSVGYRADSTWFDPTDFYVVVFGGK